MFEGFESLMIDAGEATIRVRHGGSGPPLLLLHGNPQTHAMWHKVAPRLAQDFTVVATDLRGYGDSSKPATTSDHAPYSKRAMAEDQIAVMRELGFERFFVCGHDRGGRCVYRMALDHPDRVLALAVLDIVPTWDAFSRADMAFGLGYWHWFFLAQPYDLPERLIGADPDYFFLSRLGRAEVFAPEALEEYLRCFRDPRTVHAICEDYRAAATLDFAHDEADRRRGRRMPRARPVGRPRQPGGVVRRRRNLAGVGRRGARAGAGVRPLPARGGAGRDLRGVAGLLRQLMQPRRTPLVGDDGPGADAGGRAAKLARGPRQDPRERRGRER